MAAMSSGLATLRREPAFVRWALAEGVSMFGSGVTTVVLPIIVYDATGSASQTGGLFALRVVPYLLFGLIAGAIADRSDRRRLIIGGNLVEGALVATIPIAHAFGHLTVLQVYAVGLLSATAFVFSDAAVFGTVPALVGTDRIAAANGFLYSLSSGAEIAGPVLAGILIATVGATGAIWIDTASFFVAAGVQSTITTPFRTPGTAAAASRISDQTRAALRFIRSQHTILVLTVVGFFNSLAFGIVLSLLVPYAAEQLGLPSDDGRIGLLYGSVGVGSLLAGVVFARIFRAQRVAWMTPTTIAVSAALAAALSVNDHWVAALVFAACFSWAITITIVVGITYRQLMAPDHLRSSVNVIARMVSWGGQPFGAGLGALLVAVATVRVAYAVAAGVAAGAALVALVALRRGQERAVTSDR
jgi:MFS family permease